MNFSSNKTAPVGHLNPTEPFQKPAPSANESFCKLFERQMKTTNIKSAENALISRIDEEIVKIKNSIAGICTVEPVVQVPPSEPSEDDEQPFQLLPKSQWVYTTPDKQRLKKMEELNFRESPIYEPAILHRNKRMKTVYELNERAQAVVDLNRVDGQQEVPIDLEFLRPVCSLREGQSNEFLEQQENAVCFEDVLHIDRSEEAVVVGGQIGRKKRSVDDNWYDKEMKILATCRPSKSSNKIDRRTYLKQKSLSFQSPGSSDGTPKSQSYRKSGRFISMNEFESGVGHLERGEFENTFYAEPADFSLHEEPITSPELSAIFTDVIPPFKFYNKN